MRISYVLGLALLLSGCATPLVDKDFTGPTAIVHDSNANFVKGNFVRADKTDFFVMTRADGKQTGNALSATSMLNEGRGFSLKVQEFERRVPIRPMQVELIGATYYAAPISAMFNDTREVRAPCASSRRRTRSMSSRANCARAIRRYGYRRGTDGW